MLILARCEGDFVQIGPDIQVRIIEIVRGKVRLGFVAPPDVLILRGPEFVSQEGVPLSHDLLPPSQRNPKRKS